LEEGEASDEFGLVGIWAETVTLEESFVGGLEGGLRHLSDPFYFSMYECSRPGRHVVIDVGRIIGNTREPC
jgi:hypothetical protein